MSDFDKNVMQRTLLSAGLTPRDLSSIMPCNPATLYTYLKKGAARPLTLFTFKKIEKFLSAAVEAKLLPTMELKSAKRRREGLYKAYTHWNFHSESFNSFTF